MTYEEFVRTPCTPFDVLNRLIAAGIDHASDQVTRDEFNRAMALTMPPKPTKHKPWADSRRGGNRSRRALYLLDIGRTDLFESEFRT